MYCFGFNKELSDKWSILCKIHILTKHYTLIAEECGFSMKSILQPMKEQKDAYEHIIRAYTKILESNDIEYAANNLVKAIGHEYRAFFDTIDYLMIIIRERIYNDLFPYTYEDIIKVYNDYPSFKSELDDLPFKIATFREKKDIGDDGMLLYAQEYGNLMSKALKYQKTANEIVAKIHEVRHS